MAEFHSLFIPDIEYLSDMDGLLDFLIERVCLYIYIYVCVCLFLFLSVFYIALRRFFFSLIFIF